MRPTFSADDSRHCGASDVKSLGYFPVQHSFCSEPTNFYNVSDCEGCMRIGFAGMSNTRPSPFGVHIPRVVKRRSQKEMGGITAWRIVAAMETVQSVWNRTVGNFIRDAMGEQCSSALIALDANANSSISTTIASACPKPTSRLQQWVNWAVLINLLPEAFCDRANGSCPSVMALDKSKWLALYEATAGMVDFAYWGGQTASTLAVSIRNFLCFHRLNFTTIYTCKGLRFAVNLEGWPSCT